MPAAGSFGDVQPRYVYQAPAGGERTEDEVFAGFGQLWRRNVRKAEKSGVEVVAGTRDDPGPFPPLSTSRPVSATEFTPRGLSLPTDVGRHERRGSAAVAALPGPPG